MTVPGDATYSVATTGGSADPSTSQVTVGGTPVNFPGELAASLAPTGGGAACAAPGIGCAAQVDGFLAGASADYLAFVVHSAAAQVERRRRSAARWCQEAVAAAPRPSRA